MTDALIHEHPYFFWVIVVRLEEHQLGDSALHSRVVTTDYPRLLQVIACIVAAHLYTALHTLTDVDNDLAVTGAFLQCVKQPWTLWSIATAEGSHDDSSEIGRMDNVADKVFPNAREQ